MSTLVALSRKRNGGFWGNRTFDLAVVNDRAWVGSYRKILGLNCQSKPFMRTTAFDQTSYCGNGEVSVNIDRYVMATGLRLLHWFDGTHLFDTRHGRQRI